MCYEIEAINAQLTVEINGLIAELADANKRADEAKKLDSYAQVGAATASAGHQVVPVELSDDLCNRIAVISRVWPEWDIKNTPVAFREAIRNYHSAMLQASKGAK